MNPLPQAPPPLRAAEYYLLLALAEEDLHKHAIKARIYNYSLTSLLLDNTQLDRLLRKFENEIYIEPVITNPNNTPGKPRQTYTITEHGRLRLHQDSLLLEHALKIAKRLGTFDAHT